MKKYMPAYLGGLGIVAAGIFLMPLSASADSYVPTDPCTQSNSCVSTTVQVPQSPSLADTGSSIPVALLGGAGVAVVAGGAVIVVARRKARHTG